MHGRMFWEFRDYAEAAHGAGTWLTLLKNMGPTEKVYLQKAYPDTEMVALVTAASALSGRPVAEVLEDFGAFTAPSLMEMYRHLMKPEWRTLDVIEHTEATAHSALRKDDVGMGPPFLRTKRLGPDDLMLFYSSPRKLCAVAVGVARDLAKFFRGDISVRHTARMNHGAKSCEIVFHTFAAKPVRARAHHSSSGHIKRPKYNRVLYSNEIRPSQDEASKMRRKSLSMGA